MKIPWTCSECGGPTSIEWDEEADGPAPDPDDGEGPGALCERCHRRMSRTARAWGYDARAHERATRPRP